jgi:hypothetical protein
MEATGNGNVNEDEKGRGKGRERNDDKMSRRSAKWKADMEAHNTEPPRSSPSGQCAFQLTQSTVIATMRDAKTPRYPSDNNKDQASDASDVERRRQRCQKEESHDSKTVPEVNPYPK